MSKIVNGAKEITRTLMNGNLLRNKKGEVWAMAENGTIYSAKEGNTWNGPVAEFFQAGPYVAVSPNISTKISLYARTCLKEPNSQFVLERFGVSELLEDKEPGTVPVILRIEQVLE